MSFLACLPLIEADIPAVLALDQRCLGGLWTYSGYLRELESDHSDLCVLVRSQMIEPLQQRALQQREYPDAASLRSDLAAHDPTAPVQAPITLLGVGCLWAILEEAHITTLAIEPSFQGGKLGLLLLTHLLSSGRNRGLTRATLEVRASNEKALSLYQKFAFAEAGQRKRYYADGENARILWRSGLQSEECLAQLSQYYQSAISYIHHQGKHTVFSEIT